MVRKQAFKRFYRQSAEQGYGLALLMVFVMSTMLIAGSLQLSSAPTISQYLGLSSHNNLSARELALFGMDVVMTDMQTRLNAGETVDGTYTYPVTQVSMPSDPNALSTLNSVVGSYSGTITQSRGATYVLKVNAAVGNSSYNLYRLMQMDDQVAEYDCSVVEALLFSGNIASVSNADLITYAQNDCMKRSSEVSVMIPLETGGNTTNCGDVSGSGTLNMKTVTCKMTASGTYSTVLFPPSATAAVTSGGTSGTYRHFYSLPSSGSRIVHLPGTVGDYSLITSSNRNGSGDADKSTYDHTWIFNNVVATNDITMIGGNGNDNYYFRNLTGDLYLNDGNNIAVVYGTLGKSGWNTWMSLGDDGTQGPVNDTGTNTIYVNDINTSSGKNAWIMTFSTGNTQIYFNKITGGAGTIYLTGGAGNDVIACGVQFNNDSDGTNDVCGSISSGSSFRPEGLGGNDIISIDILPPANAVIYGNDYDNPGTTEATANLIYTKGCSGSTTIKTNNTASLVISGGNRASGCTIDGQGGTSVLMVKSGTTSSGTISNFARTITY